MPQRTIFSFYPIQNQRKESDFNDNSQSSHSSDRQPEDGSQPVETPSQNLDDTSLCQTESSSSYSRQGRDSHRSPETMNRRAFLREIAKETKSLIPGLIDRMPQARPSGYLYSPPNPPILKPSFRPGLPPTKVRVVDGDSFDTAISLAKCAQFMDISDTKPVCVLNMANAFRAGGGWASGALAQEEALCYRSSLIFSLKLRYYPMEHNEAIYSPSVVIFRDNLQNGYKLFDLNKTESLPIVSVVSVAALDRPELDDSVAPPRYKHSEDRESTKDKMRLILRVAVCNRHRRIVLGAFGCGAFLNPNQEVACCWAEVLREPEFKGWWENVVFAIMNDGRPGMNGEGNFQTFQRVLHGLVV